MQIARIAAALVLLAAACGNDGTTAGGDGGADTLADHVCPFSADKSATPASGGGFCCPATADCSGGSTGGWAANASDCCSRFDFSQDQPFKTSTDSHGCTVKTPIYDHSMCCGCALDSGSTQDVTSE